MKLNVRASRVPAPLTVKDFKGKAEPDWCPGCGDFGVLVALKQALAELGVRPHEAMVISGIGCSSNLPGYISTYGMHTLHGRALSVATGAQMANHELKIIVTGGDGDGYGIGGNHFVHTHAPQCRRDLHRDEQSDLRSHDRTTVADQHQGHENQKHAGRQRRESAQSDSAGDCRRSDLCGRAYTGQVKHMVELIKGGIQHRGFSLIDAFSPCVTFNLENDHDFFKQRTFKLEDKKHDPTDFAAAMKYGYEWGDEIAIGLFWKRDDLPALDQLEPVLDEGGPLARRPLGISPEAAQIAGPRADVTMRTLTKSD